MTDAIIAGILSAIPLPAVLIDAGERIAGANDGARTLLGPQIEGRHCAAILRQPQLLGAIEATLADKSTHMTRLLTSDGGQDVTYEVSCRPVERIDSAGMSGVLVCFQDITRVQQAGQMRRDFVANVSHELRTPLTALMGFIETLRGPARDDAKAQERFLEIMESEAGRMNRLIGDLLSLSRLEGQQRVRPRDRVDLGKVLAATLSSLKPLADASAVELKLDLPDGETSITGDADQVRQVFTNLVDNAIKYGGSGGVVRLVATRHERDAALRGPAMRVEVADYGAGIDPAHLARLTERFYRVDNHRSRELGGTGLGLAIVKHIISRHRGRLRVESEPGKGAVFTVILPR